jgi:DNA-directed RNA polymerase specialized sigma24 family protein
MSKLDPLDSLNAKMDSLIRIQAALAVRGMATQREKIVFLYGAGLGPTFIADLLGITPTNVSVSMAKHRKAVATRKDEVNE